MKKLALLLCTAVFVLVGCEKEDPEKPSDTPTQIDSALAAPIQNFPATAEVIYDAVIDIEGHHYDAVKIGDQIWMASNLRTARYANGDWIPEEDFVVSFIKPYRYKPSGDFSLFGYLYNWTAVMHWDESSNTIPSGVQGVCPDGWHVPSAAEWEQLRNYCFTHSECFCNESSGRIAKSLAADHSWQYSGKTCVPGNDLSANNITGFSAVPAGTFCCIDYPEFGGSFWGVEKMAYYWSSYDGGYQTNAYGIGISYNSHEVPPTAPVDKSQGFSVRCLKNDPPIVDSCRYKNSF
ncbi:MAG: fibrobacter succinogenes major paralogous domain-containing protein [Bacteroidales bacterium]|nr:fibrobacter succinogenes major paralogous domain-containing protein [Bacteroidales bacterium]